MKKQVAELTTGRIRVYLREDEKKKLPRKVVKVRASKDRPILLVNGN